MSESNHSQSDRDDEEDFAGGLFQDEDDAPPPEYPIETLWIDRAAIVREGKTWKDFQPLFDRFDQIPPSNGYVTASALPSLCVHYRNKRHSLWGHKLWNAAKYLVKRMDQQCVSVRGKTVLELGAGLGVPALSAHHNGASLVVVTDYPDADLLDIIQLNVDKNCAPNSCSTEAPLAQGIVRVEPLLWGKAEHIEKVMSYTNGKGFDVILLSDILFNHVCNDDLAATVAAMLSWQNNGSSIPVAYCVFSHHRAHKQLEDFEFFDKCIAKGLYYELVDQEDYPLMFPEDRGPEEVRQPVNVYRITRQPPPNSPHGVGSGCASQNKALSAKESVVDVVIQGTSLPQCILSAALSRVGLKVLHCDAAGFYGGAYATLPLRDFTDMLQGSRSSSYASFQGVPPSVCINRISELYANKAESSSIFNGVLVDLLPQSFFTRGEVIQQLLDSKLTSFVEFQFLDRLLLMHTRKDSSAGMKQCHFVAQDVPLTRAGMFSTPAALLSLMEKRRVMQLIKELEPILVEGFHAENAPLGDEPLSPELIAQSEDAAIENFVKDCVAFYKMNQKSFTSQGVNGDDEMPSFRCLLQDKYRLSDNAADIVLLLGQLEHFPQAHAPLTRGSTQADVDADEHSDGKAWRRTIMLQRQLLTSIGRFNSPTPFLQMQYGVGELPQAMARLGAISGGGLFALDRGVQRVVLREDKGEDRLFAVMSNNGQHVETRVVVLPEGRGGQIPLRFQDFEKVLEVEEARNAGNLAQYEVCVPHVSHDTEPKGPTVCFSRVVMLLKVPFFTALNMPAPVNKGSEEEEVSESSVTSKASISSNALPPTVVALCRVKPDDNAENSVVVHVAQISASTEQVPASAPQSHVLLHFTSNGHDISPDELYTKIIQKFFIAQETSASPSPDTLTILKEHVAFAAYFSLDSDRIVEDSIRPTPLGDVPSPTQFAHEFSRSELRKVVQAKKQQREHLLHPHTAEGDATEDNHSTEDMKVLLSKQERLEKAAYVTGRAVVSMPILSSCLMDESAALLYAKQAYAKVLRQLGKMEDISKFLEPLPSPSA